jgi:hypothetical protein
MISVILAKIVSPILRGKRPGTKSIASGPDYLMKFRPYRALVTRIRQQAS